MEVVVGRIGRPHGVRGEVAVDVRSDQPELRFAPGSELSAVPPTVRGVQGPGSPRTLTITSARWHRDSLLVTFEGVGDRDAAARLRGASLVVDVEADEQPDDPDEFFDHQLVGLRVARADGAPVGEVAEVLHLPMQDVLAVRRDDGGEVLLPFVAEIVPEVDLEARRVVVDPPPGLLDRDEP